MWSSEWFFDKYMISEKWIRFPLETVILAFLNWGIFVLVNCSTKILLRVGAGLYTVTLKSVETKIFWLGRSASCITQNNTLPPQEGHPMDLAIRVSKPGSAWCWAPFLSLWILPTPLPFLASSRGFSFFPFSPKEHYCPRTWCSWKIWRAKYWLR